MPQSPYTLAQLGMQPQTYDSSQWDRRTDGSMKGNGFLGTLVRPDGGVSSELSMGTEDVTGKETEIPLLVPTLTAPEVSYLLTAPPGDWKNPTLKRIADKAITFARQRQASGLPFFARPGEEQESMHPQFPRASVRQLNGDIAIPNTSGHIDPRLLPTLAQLGLPSK